jgi:hypothetical protein
LGKLQVVFHQLQDGTNPPRSKGSRDNRDPATQLFVGINQ